MGYARIKQFSDEIHWYEYSSPYIKTTRKHFQKRKSPAGREKTLVCRSDFSVHRAKTAFFELVAHNLYLHGKPALVTFTVYDDDCSFSDIFTAISSFKRFYEKRRKTRISYIAVPERGSLKGRVHVHALVWGLLNSDIKKERNSRNLQRLYAKGFLDVRSAYDSSKKLASYLAKYLTKQEYRFVGERSYTVGGAIERTRTFGSNTLATYRGDLINEQDYGIVRVEQYRTEHLGTCYKTIYKKNK